MISHSCFRAQSRIRSMRLSASVSINQWIRQAERSRQGVKVLRIDAERFRLPSQPLDRLIRIREAGPDISVTEKRSRSSSKEWWQMPPPGYQDRNLL